MSKDMTQEWRSIWEKAVETNCDMNLNLREGSQRFKDLITQHPNDGMIYYEYAEAFEYRKKYDFALKNYQKAKELFPRDEWQNFAQAGIDRVLHPLKEPPKSLETIYHKIHTFKLLNSYPSLKYRILFSMGKSLNDKVMCLLTARTIIESIVYDFLYKNVEPPEEIKLNDEIKKFEGKINKNILEKMDNLRLAGNAVVHLRPKQEARGKAVELEKRIFELYDVIEEFYS